MEIFIIKYCITEFEKRNKFFEKNEMYKARKETIERVFADAKEQPRFPIFQNKPQFCLTQNWGLSTL